MAKAAPAKDGGKAKPGKHDAGVERRGNRSGKTGQESVGKRAGGKGGKK
jgi:hypothetical protein